MNINWRVIPNKDQRYESSGDWYWEGDTLHIRISHLSNSRFEFCLGLHELVEAMLCWYAGISQEDVDAFDMPYEAAYQRGDKSFPCGCENKYPSDPGSDKHAPYGFQHKIAEGIERIVAAILGITWAEYEAEVDRPPGYEGR